MLKFLMMPFVFFVLVGFPTPIGNTVATFSNFVPMVFFILYGFFNLVPDQTKRYEKLKRGFRRAAKLFAIMFVCYLALNLIFLASTQQLTGEYVASLLHGHTLFNFLVLNVWPLPVGNGIWFVQSVTYAYLFFLFIEKLKLDKFYLPIMVVLILFMLASGEFSALCGFPYFGYLAIPAGAVTRAIPYMLIGMVLRKHVDLLSKLPRYLYLVFFAVGLAAAVGEFMLLSHWQKLFYTGHAIGFGVMALSLCCFVLAKPMKKRNYFTAHGESYSRRMYAFCQPVAFVLWMLTATLAPYMLGIVIEFNGLLSLVICFMIAFLISSLKKALGEHFVKQLILPHLRLIPDRKRSGSVKKFFKKTFRRH